MQIQVCGVVSPCRFQTPFPPGRPEIEIPDSHHHIMIDQPLALLAALRTLFAVWPTA